MRSIGAYVGAALALAALSAVALAAGRLQHGFARADEALVSLDFVESARAYDELERYVGYGRYVPWIGNDALRRIRASRAAVRYWDGDYDALLSLARGEAADGAADTELLFIAANAAYRLGLQRAADGPSMLRAVDDARTAYRVVLRDSGNHPDAAFNYEYMLVVRDRIATGGRLTGAKPQASDEGAAPVQQTLHGREGGPPPGRSQKEFKVYVPEDRDERQNDSAPGSDQVRQRKG
jgi:hypothetical protein